MTPLPHCAVCSRREQLSGILVGGRTLLLCAPHHRRLAGRLPTNFTELAALVGGDADSPDAGSPPPVRQGRDRRVAQRRQFPPRPEGRRHNDGRRLGE